MSILPAYTAPQIYLPKGAVAHAICTVNWSSALPTGVKFAQISGLVRLCLEHEGMRRRRSRCTGRLVWPCRLNSQALLRAGDAAGILQML
jgi:hypothetical protein